MLKLDHTQTGVVPFQPHVLQPGCMDKEINRENMAALNEHP